MSFGSDGKAEARWIEAVARIEEREGEKIDPMASRQIFSIWTSRYLSAAASRADIRTRKSI